MTTFGERLRTLRREAGLSQQDLAGETLSPSYVSLLEADKRQASADVVAHLAARLGCTAAHLDASESAEQARVRAAMELEYARITIANGGAADAVARLRAALDSDAVDQPLRDEMTLLLARALELSDDVSGAVVLLLPLLERSIAGRSLLPVTTVGHALCARYLQRGELTASVEVGERALRHAEAAGLAGTDEHLTLAATVVWAHCERGDLLHAAALAARYAGVAAEHGNRVGQGMIYWNAALVAEAAGRLQEALALAQRATAFLSEGSTTRHLIRLRTQLAWLLVRADPLQAAEAARLLDGLTDDLADLCGPADRALWACHRGYVHLVLGEPEDAERLARQALLALTGQTMSETPLALLILGDAVHTLGRTDEAIGHWRAVIEVLGGRAASRQKAAALREAGERLLGSGHTGEGLTTLQLALDAAGIPVAAAPAVTLAPVTARPAVSAAGGVHAVG